MEGRVKLPHAPARAEVPSSPRFRPLAAALLMSAALLSSGCAGYGEEEEVGLGVEEEEEGVLGGGLIGEEEEDLGGGLVGEGEEGLGVEEEEGLGGGLLGEEEEEGLGGGLLGEEEEEEGLLQ